MCAAVLGLASCGLPAARAADAVPPEGSDAAGVVALPPFQLDAVEPPWARDTRTAVTSVVPLSEGFPATVADALRAAPGVHLVQPGGPGGRSSIFLRGGEENYTVVLLDGVPVNNPTDSRGGGFDFGTLDASGFTVAEIVPGPVSARYGPDALAGVVKLASDVTTAPDGTAVSAQAGGQGYAAAHLVSAVRDGPFGAAASGGWSEDGRRSDGSFARRASVAAAAAWRGPAVAGQVVVRYGRAESASFPDDSGGPRYAVLKALEERASDTTTASVDLESPAANGPGLRWRLRSWGAWLHARDDSPGVAPGVRDPMGLPASLETTRLRRGGLSFEAAAPVGRDGTLAAGLDGETERGESDASLAYGPLELPASFRSTRDRVGAFAEYTWQPGPGWLLQPSARVDKAQGYGWRATPRLGLRVPLGPRTALRANAGTGFKRPSFYALSNPLVGNPALRPERSQALDLGIEQALAGGRATLSLGGFSNRYRDGIDFDPGPPPRLVNRALIRSDGAELSGRMRVSDTLELGVSGTYARVRSEPGGAPLRGRPRLEGAVRAAWRPARALAVEVRTLAVDRMADSSVPTGDRMLAAWSRTDLAVRYELRGASVTLGVDNVFNQAYEEAVGTPSPGVRLRGGLEVRF